MKVKWNKNQKLFDRALGFDRKKFERKLAKLILDIRNFEKSTGKFDFHYYIDRIQSDFTDNELLFMAIGYIKFKYNKVSDSIMIITNRDYINKIGS